MLCICLVLLSSICNIIFAFSSSCSFDWAVRYVFSRCICIFSYSIIWFLASSSCLKLSTRSLATFSLLLVMIFICSETFPPSSTLLRNSYTFATFSSFKMSEITLVYFCLVTSFTSELKPLTCLSSSLVVSSSASNCFFCYNSYAFSLVRTAICVSFYYKLEIVCVNNKFSFSSSSIRFSYLFSCICNCSSSTIVDLSIWLWLL